MIMPLLYNFDEAKNYQNNLNDDLSSTDDFGNDWHNSVREKLTHIFNVIGSLKEEELITEFKIQKPTLKSVYNKIVDIHLRTTSDSTTFDLSSSESLIEL